MRAHVALQFELAMGLTATLDADEVLGGFARTLLRRLSLRGVAAFACEAEGLVRRCTVPPRYALTVAADEVDALAARPEAAALPPRDLGDGVHRQVFSLPRYGALVLDRHGAPLPAETVGALLAFSRPGARDPEWADPRRRAALLEELQAEIIAAPLDPDFLALLIEKIDADFDQAKMRFRSSTNAEDLEGFTGAGLYTSKSGDPGDPTRPIADAVREVWASVWLLGAVEERDWYRVDQRRVAMALLVQPFVDGASANGVAITANPYFEGRPGFFVNAQALGGSVTGAAGNEVPEQHLIYVYSEVVESELLSQSSRSPNALLLPEAAILQLASTLRTLHCHFRDRWRARGMHVDTSDALDVEYLIAGEDHHLVILQARPFEVRYEDSQRVGDLDLCAFHPAGVD